MKGLNAVASFVSILRSTANSKVQEKILSALNEFIKEGEAPLAYWSRPLTSKAEHYQPMLMQMGVGEAVIGRVNSTESATQTAAVRCMLLLSSSAQNKEGLLAADAITHLQRLGQSPSPSLKAVAAKCISFLQ